jgi:hypothetical protein
LNEPPEEPRSRDGAKTDAKGKKNCFGARGYAPDGILDKFYLLYFFASVFATSRLRGSDPLVELAMIFAFLRVGP